MSSKPMISPLGAAFEQDGARFRYWAPDRERIDTIIVKELVNGIFREEARLYLNEVLQGLKEQGCDAAVLGCTEIPLLVDPADCPLPTLDSTRLLAALLVVPEREPAVDEPPRGVGFGDFAFDPHALALGRPLQVARSRLERRLDLAPEEVAPRELRLRDRRRNLQPGAPRAARPQLGRSENDVLASAG